MKDVDAEAQERYSEKNIGWIEFRICGPGASYMCGTEELDERHDHDS
jgi:hypothetical protein